MKVKKILELLEEKSPLSAAESWDNPGLLVGDLEREVHCVYIALDATDEVIEHAITAGAELVLTHHPLIFGKIGQVRADDYIGRRIIRLIEHKMSIICMHTNFDVFGMADIACEKLSLQNPLPLDVTGEDTDGRPVGIGAYGELQDELALTELADLVKNRFGLEQVKVFGDPFARIKRCAVCPGSGKSEVDHAIAAGAQVLVTGDIDHHTGIDAVARGVNIIDAGHYGIEHIFIPYMEQYLKKAAGELTIASEPFEEPFYYI
ncbi:dinuclear metal center protein, YbgI/SA1388 family [Lachnospiraceae bacterium C10]|nr:dinuclear metal center protein, YbgI/SA1388 family [Lachnospiraceae bacterium C10]